MFVNIHENYIKRCISIGKNGLGKTRPNPMVGCVIVHNNKIIGEGYTSAYGSHHAEVNAINSVKNKIVLQNATLYVTLEPCSHHGKTPPCADFIIKHNIKTIVIGTVDDHSKVAGQGIKKLRDAGCQVTVGVLENECREHHKRFFTLHNEKRPYIILKWAETSDGFIAPIKKDVVKPIWITSPNSRQLVHKWRSEEHAILVGTQTVIDDNPSLTVRDWAGEQPIRIILDKSERITKEHNIFNDKAQTICIGKATIDWQDKNSIAKQICDVLFKLNISSVIIEGGAKTLQTFINENLWDEARVFSGPLKFNAGINAPLFKGNLYSEESLNEDLLKIYKND